MSQDENGKIRILIVEDHFVTRFGLNGLIGDQKDMQVAGEAKNGAEAVSAYRECKPGLVMMDLRMPGFDGIQATAAICSADPHARILVVSSYDTEADVLRVLEAGALGYITKEAEPEELLRAIRFVSRGERYLSQALEARLAGSSAQPRLNAREVQLLELIAQGLSNREIAEKVSLTAGTVRIYVSNILAKLGVNNRAEAVSLALQRGFLRSKK